MEENKNRNLDIKEALERISVDYVDAEISEKSTKDGILELEFNKNANAGLVFEVDTDASADAELTAQDTAPKEEEILPAVEEPAPAATEEFEIPDSREVKESFDSLLREAEKTKIFTTYIPRFTEASENYRMVGEKTTDQTSSEIHVSKAYEAPVENIDPTAELPAEAEAEAVIVTAERGVKLEEYAESISVFKFSGEDSALYADTAEDSAESDTEALPEASEETEADAPKAPTGLNDFSSYCFSDKPKAEAIEIIPATANEPHEQTSPTAMPDVPKENSKRRRSSEYTAFYQRDSFKDRFLDSILSVRIRLASVILLSLAILVFENIGYLGVDLAAMLGLSRVPYAIHVIDLQFSICLFLLALPEVALAVGGLRKRTVSPELSLILSMALVVTLSVANILVLPEKPLYVGFVFAVHVLVVVVGSCLRYLADFSAFKSTSKNTEKRVVDISMTSSLSKENLALDGAVDSYKSRTVRLFRASFITDFFKRTGKRTETSGANLTVMITTLGISLVSAAVAFFLLDGWISAAYALALTYLIGTPVVSSLAHKLPYYRAQRIAGAEKTVIVGESSLFEYKDADVITFDDTEIFGADDVVLKRFMLYGDRENVARAMKLMSALFSSVGGPLDNIFASTLDKRVLPAQSVTIEDDGVKGMVDGKEVCAGNYEYMLRHGVISARDDSVSDNAADTTKVMYAAEGGALIAKFYVRYSFSEEFSSLFTELRKNGIVPLVYTRDPNVNNELMNALTIGQGGIRVLKQRNVPLSAEESVLNSSTGIVTFKDKISAIRTVLLAKRYSTLQGAISVLAYVLMAIGIGASVVLTFLRIGSPSLLLAVWHLVGYLALGIMGKRYLSDRKK